MKKLKYFIILSLLLLTPLLYAQEQVIILKSAEGYVEIMRANQTSWERASVGAKLSSNDKIRTRLESLASLEYPDGTTLTLRENSFLTIQDISQDSKSGLVKRELKLNLGGMKYRVSKIEEKGSEFKIHSSTAIVGVTGTEGIITTGGDKKPTQNTLLEGTTYNTDETGKGGRPLSAGNSWVIDENAKTDKHMTTDEDKAENEYKEPDKTLIERFNKFVAAFNQKKSEGYIADEQMLEIITQAYLARDYARLAELLDIAEKSLESFKKPADEKAQKISQAIANLKNELEEKEKQGAAVNEVYLIYNKIIQFYQEANYDASLDLIEQIRQKLMTLEKTESNFMQLLDALTEEINQKAKAGFMVEEAVETAKKADIAYKSGNPAEAIALLEKAKTILAQAKQEIPPGLLEEIEKIRQELSDKKKEGFVTTEIQDLLNAADAALKDNKYAQAQGLIRQIKEKLAAIKKAFPDELAYLLKTFEDNLKNQEALGFDLTNLGDSLKLIYDAKDAGDFEKLKALLQEATAALLKLEIPQGLSLRLQQVKKELEEKINYSPAEIERLNNQIQAALDKKDLRQLRILLDHAETFLAALKDTQPPFLQVSDLAYKENLVIVSGIAKDNVKLDSVRVNANSASFDETGHFSKELLLVASLKEITVVAADSQGNLSPEIKIIIPEEKIPQEDIAQPAELKEQDIKLNYTADSVIVSGKTSPGANLIANGINITVGANGEFSFSLTGSVELVQNGLTINNLKLDIQDKWLPQVNNIGIQLYDNMPPVLKTEDLNYDKDKVLVKGNCQDAANIVIEGEVRDIGTGINEVTVNTEKALLENGNFKHTLLLKPELRTVEIIAADVAGNKRELSRPIDLFLLPAVVKINGSAANLSAGGDFSTELYASEDLKEIIIQAQDYLKNEATPIKLIVADRIPPRIILGDIFYENNTVTVTGQTQAYSLVYDKDSLLFSDKVTADSAGLFKINIPQPKNAVTAILIAQDPSGNLSEGLNLTIDAPKDELPPLLTVANLNFQGNKVIVSGSAEDDTGIKSVTINEENVDLANNIFSKEITLSPDLIKIVVTATDLTDKTTSVEKVVTDIEKPVITLDELAYEKGYCIVKGNATDNIGIKEVRVNSIPVDIKTPEGGDFTYRLPISAELKEIIATAIDRYGNYQDAPAKKVDLPADGIAPTLTLNELIYGSPKVMVSGIVSDNVSLKSVLINDQPINFYEDGTFKTELNIKIGSAGITLNDPIYSQGFVLVSGRVNPPTQDPSQITAIAEDLSGNKSMLLKREINALDLNQFRVLVNGEPVSLENGSFKTNLLLEKGLSEIKIQAIDSLGNPSEEVTLPLEKTPPLLSLDEPVYTQNGVTISGKATDSGSGLGEILINNTSSPFDSDGKFSKTLGITESNIVVMALDKLGNAATSTPIKLSPPDKSAPVFILKINPVPATVGKDVSINIDVLDTKTRLPEILEEPPLVNALLSNAENKNIVISGTGASFYGTLSTTDLATGLIKLSVKGSDKSGNLGDKIEGLDSFLLNAADNTAPGFTVTLASPAQAIAGKDIKLNISSSETLKSLPKATVNLPATDAFEIALEGPLNGTSFNASLSIPSGTPPGSANIQLSDALDLSGNMQSSPVIYNFTIETEKIKSSVPLRIEFSEINPERIMIKGSTAAKAIVRISLADIKTDLAADENGSFVFFKEIFPQDLERWRKSGPSVLFNCYATNYAGLSSERITFNIPLPGITPTKISGGNFTVEIIPFPLEQGQQAQFNISSAQSLKEPPRLTIRLSDGKIESINVSGSGRDFKGTYQSTPATAVGPAIIEIKSENLFETRPYRITSSSENYALMSGMGFFSITANPDPLPQGKDLDVSVYAQRPVNKIPTLNIRLPGGKLENIPLSGDKTEFKGKYTSPKDITPGPAELIVNMGERNELRRPFGIASPGGMRFGEFIRTGDIFAFSNPMPMFTGAPATITVKSAQGMNELPSAELRLNNGQIIPVTLNGSLPGNMFIGQVNIPKETPFGPATITVKNKAGIIIAEYPTGIAPAFATAQADIEAIMIPATTMPGRPVTINVNSRRGTLNFLPKVKLILSDNTILPVILEPRPPSTTFKGVVNILQNAAAGPVRIIVNDEAGNLIANGQGQITITTFGAAATGGGIKISALPPNPIPGKPLEVLLYSDDSLRLLPKITLFVPEKTPIDLRAEGNVPGNSFRASTTFPADARVSGAKIEVRFDRGSGEEMQTLFLEGGAQDMGPRPPKLTPYPPVAGQPLIITLYAPSIINFLPNVRVNYITGSETVTMSGAIPGDTFTGTLAKVNMPLKSVDVLDNKGSLLVSLPIEMLGATTGMFMPPPQMEVMPMPIMPGTTATLSLNLPMPAYGFLTANIKLSDGRVVPIILNGASGGNYFNGMFSIPFGSPLGQAILEVYMDGQPIPGARMPVSIGGETMTASGDILGLMAYPGGPGELILDWQLSLSGAVKYRIAYEAAGVTRKTIDIGIMNHYSLSGLQADLDYRVILIALDATGKELGRSERMIRLPSQTGGFSVYANPSGPGNLQINWDYHPNAVSYVLRYAKEPLDPKTQAGQNVGNTTGYFLSNLTSGNYRILIEAVLSTGERIASREGIGYVGGATDYGKPPIDLYPAIPIVGQPLDMDVMLPMVVPASPKITAKYLTQGEEPFMVTGTLPGSRFHGRIPLVKDQVLSINFYDPMTGELRFSYPLTGVSMMGIPTDLRVKITVNPEPPVVGTNLNINLDFNQTIDFYKLNLRAYAEFTDGREITLPVTGTAPAMSYKATLSAAQHTTAIRLIGVEGPNLVPDEYINTQLTGGRKAVILTTPDAPLIGTSVQVKVSIVNVNTNQASSITAYPKIIAEFVNGQRTELGASGTLPNSEFNAQILAANFTSALRLIDVEYEGALLGTKTFNITSTVPMMFGPNFTPNPPNIGSPLNLILDLSPNEPALVNVPKVRINYASGITPAYEFMTVTGALPGRSFQGTLTLVKGPALTADFIDPITNTVMHTFTFGAMGYGSVTGWVINVNPMPPSIGQALTITLSNASGQMQSLLPYIRFYFDDGTQQEFLMAGTIPGSTFTYTLSQLLKTPQRAEAWDNAKANKLVEMPFAAMGLPVIRDPIPNPPSPGTYTEFPVEFPGVVPFKPKIVVAFSDNTEKILEVTPAAPAQIFTGKLYAADFKFTNSIKVKVYDDYGGFLVERYFSLSVLGYPLNLWDEATGLATERRIHWDTVSGAAGYDIYAGLSNPPTIKWREVIGGNINAETISGLSNGQTYYYYVTVRGSSTYGSVKSFTAGAGTTTGGNLQLISPVPGADGAGLIEFSNTNAGSTTNTISVSIKNISNATINAKTQIFPLMNTSDLSKTISSSSINFPASLSIPGGNTTINQNIYITVPSGATSGEYMTPPSNRLIIYDDANNNGIKDTGESSVALNLKVTVGAVVQGISITEGGVDFGSVAAGGNSSTNTIHVSNTAGVNLTFIKTILPDLNKEGAGATISSTNIHFSLNSAVTGVLGATETTSSTIYISLPGGTTTGVYVGSIRIYNDANNNNTFQSDTEPSDTLPLRIDVGSSNITNHITIAPSATSSNVGTPVLVKLTAYSSTDNTTINTSHSTPVTIKVTETTSSTASPNYLLSTKDRVTGDTAGVQMTSGIGYFTIDAIKPTVVSLETISFSNPAQPQITFNSNTSGLSFSQLVLDCDSTAKTGMNSDDGVLITVSAVDINGKVITNYSSQITISITDPALPTTNLSLAKGAGTLSGNFYTYATADNGEVVFRLKDSIPENVSFAITAPVNPPVKTITFAGINKFILEASGVYTTNATVTGSRIKFIAYTATNAGTRLAGYSGTATWNRGTETISNNSSQAVPSSIDFTNGRAEFYVEDNEYETITFNISDSSSGINSDPITVNFVSSDPTPPDISKVVAETPFLIHIYFTEEVDSTSARVSTNYTGVGSIRKVCWYGDEVTLHLAGPLELGKTNQTVTIAGIKDNNGNFINPDPKTSSTFSIPNVDYQGTANSGTDWLEINTSPSNAPVGSSQTIRVIVSHKNACGYLSGSNAANRSDPNISPITLTYSNASLSGSASQTMSDGRVEFNITANFSTAGTATITATSNSGITSGTAIITSP